MPDGLLDRARAGDAEAFGQLLNRHAPQLVRAIARGLPTRWQSLLSTEDVLQASFTDAYCALPQLAATDDAGFGAWLRRLADHNLQDAIRALEADKRGGARRRVTGGGPGDSRESLLEALFATDSQTPSRVMMRGEADLALQKALQQLPEAYRRAVELYDLRELPIDIVAAELQRSPGATHLLRFRAHKRLRDLLAASGSIYRTRV